MTDTPNHKHLRSYVAYNPPKRKVIAKILVIVGHIFDSIFNAMQESRRREAEREIAKFAALQGGRITDDLERQMTRRLFSSDWSARE